MLNAISRHRAGWKGPLFTAALLAALAGLLAACGPLPPGTATPGPTAPGGNAGEEGSELAGSEWQLASLQGQAPLPGTQITLLFRDDEVGGFAGCNAYGSASDGASGEDGGYEARDGRLRLPMMAQTAMACLEPEGVMDQESAYMDALQQATGYRLAGETLELLDGAGQTLLTFRRQEEVSMDPTALLGTAWGLLTLNDELPVEGSTLTLAFLDGSRASGHAGCRDYVAGYQAGEDGIHFYYTAMMGWQCVMPGSQDRRDALQRQEGAFTDALGWTDRFRLAEDGQQLELLSQRGESLVLGRLAPEELPPVAGTEWVLLSFAEPNTAAGPEMPMVAPLDVITETGTTLSFQAGTAAGTAGCNQYSAAYSLQGTTITFEAPVTTKMLCQQPAGIMEQEQRFLTWLAAAETAQVHGRELWLETGDGRALVFYAPYWQ